MATKTTKPRLSKKTTLSQKDPERNDLATPELAALTALTEKVGELVEEQKKTTEVYVELLRCYPGGGASAAARLAEKFGLNKSTV